MPKNPPNVLAHANSKTTRTKIQNIAVVSGVATKGGSVRLIGEVQLLLKTEFLSSEFLVSELLRSGAPTSQLTSLAVQEARSWQTLQK